jgi:hypothetical protein
MQYKPVLLVLSGFAAAALAFTLLGPGDTVTVEKQTLTKGRADVTASGAERLQLAEQRPKFEDAEDTGQPPPPNGRKAGPGGASGAGPGGKEGGVAQQKQPMMTPEQAEQQHQQAWQGMQQSIQRVATKHNLSPETTTEISGAIQGYMGEQKALWDSVAAGEISQEEAMAQSMENRAEIQGQIAEAAGEEVAGDMGGMLGGGAPGDAQGNMGGPPGAGGPPPRGGGMGRPPGGGGMGPPPGGR